MTTAKYLRLSSEDTDLRNGMKQESNSIGNQRNLLDAFISRTPELAEGTVIEFCDDGWSGKNFDRPAVQELLAQVKQGMIQCIVVKDLSRFGRDYFTVGNYISRIFPFLGIRFIAINDGFDSNNSKDIDSLETSFKTILYDLYSRDLSRKVRKARRFRAERGEFLAPFAPFGFDKDPAQKNHLVIDLPAAEIVRRIFQMAGNGQTTMQIARILNNESVPTPMLYKRAAGCSRTIWPCVHEDNFWTCNTVSKILRDERYIGKNIYGKRTRDVIGSTHTVKVWRKDWIVVADTHTGIITKEEFDRAQDSMRVFAEREGQPLSAARGKLRCGVCGHSLVKSVGKSNFFYCRTPLVSDLFDCAEVHILESDIEETLLEGLRVQTAFAVEMSHIWKERQQKAKKNVAATVKTLSALKEAHSKQTQKIKSLYESFFTGEIGKAEYLAMKATAIKERDAIASQIAEMEASLENWGTDGTLQNRFVDSFKQYAEVQALTDEIIGDALDTVYIHPGGRLEIIWNYQDDFQRLLLDLSMNEKQVERSLENG